MQEIAEDKGFTVHLFECGEGDHVTVWRPSEIIHNCDREIPEGDLAGNFERFPEMKLLWKGELWNHSYYVETVGSVSEENIRRYIEHQSKAY